MGSVPRSRKAHNPLLPVAKRVAIYARVSGEEQAERGTVQAQLDFLRKWCDLNEVVVAGEYVDDGVSGAVPIAERPYGRLLVDDAKGGRFQEVVVYRLDRLGRKLGVILEAHALLDATGVTIRSATEPFDTSSPFGRFIFQFLASLAELERDTINDRMSQGRERGAKGGKWTNGPIPIGYDLDERGCLVPSERLVEATGKSEHHLIRELFERVAAGSSSIAEARRFNALGVPLDRRYGGGTTVKMSKTEAWPSSRIRFIIHNPTYKGTHVLHTPRGDVERAVPALVSEELWDAANARLARNQSLCVHGHRSWLLRGLIRCADCGSTYAGTPRTSRSAPNWHGLYYRCGSQLGTVHADPAKRCRSKQIPADRIEAEVWEEIRAFIHNPGESLADARRQLREKMEQSAGLDDERRRLLAMLNGKEAERERVQTLFRRGRMSLDEAEAQIDAISKEAADIRAELDSKTAQAELARTFETRVTDAAVMLARARDNFAEAERTNDPAKKRQLIDLLVREITVHTEPSERGARKRATARIHFWLRRSPTVASVDSGNSRGRTLCKGSGSSGTASRARG